MYIAIMGTEEEPYSNRQIERMMDQQSAVLMAHITKSTDPILAQTIKTNGRVTMHDTQIGSLKVWRGWMTGGMAVLMIFLPIVVTIMVSILLRVLNFDSTVKAAVSQEFDNRVQSVTIPN